MIDLARSGRHHYKIHVAAAGETAGRTAIDVTVIANGAGPTILLTGGVHGDEFEGPVALLKLARSLSPDDVAGRIIIVPIANAPAVDAAQRASPRDGLDLNRAFPGGRGKSLTEAIAAELLALAGQADIVFDLHAGGTRYTLLPCVLIHPVADLDLLERTLAAGLAFGALACILIDEGSKAGMFDTEVERRGEIFGCAELGGCGSLSAATLAVAERGIVNLLVHFGILKGSLAPSASQLLVTLADDQHELSPHAGLFEPFHEIGDTVAAGSAIGQVHQLDAQNAPPTQVFAKQGGVLFFRHAGGTIAAGDAVTITGTPSDLANSIRQAAASRKRAIETRTDR